MEGTPRQPAVSDDTYTTDATTMAFCNGRYFGGGMCISPEASLTDRRLSVTVWRERVLGFALGLLSIYSGRAAKWRSTSSFETADALVAPADADAAAADGQRETGPVLPAAALTSIQFEVDGELGCALPALVGVAPVTVRFATVPAPGGSVSVPI
jgi:diacylglycerol kinase family enzyme